MSQRGHVRKRGETWTAYWFVRDADGKRVQRSEGGKKTKGDAQALLTEKLGAIQAGTYSEPRKITLARFLRDEWLPTLTQRPTTRASYQTTCEHWIIPTLGGELLPQLTAAHAQRLVDALRAEGGRTGSGLSPRSVQYAGVVLRMALQHATIHGFIARNPLAGFKRPAAPRKEMRAWTADQAAFFLDHVADDRLYAAWLLFLQRGLRRGEVGGLRWANVDMEHRRLSIVHTRVVVDGHARESQPKTGAGRRTVPLGDRLVAALSAHHRRQLGERMAWGEAGTDSGYVFTAEDGSPLHPEHFSTAFECHARRAGLPLIRLHDARHTCATLALQAGEKTEVVSRWIGHSSVSITQDIYQHAIPSMIEEAGDRLDEIVFSRRRRDAAIGRR
jgi:integrase